MPCFAQQPAGRAAIPPAQVAEEVRRYRLNNEDRIMRELTEFLAIPNVASDTRSIPAKMGLGKNLGGRQTNSLRLLSSVGFSSTYSTHSSTDAHADSTVQ